MYQPETYAVALSFMIVSMLCWGSWANTVKLCPGYRFQLFYWDYVIGLLVGALAWGLTLGTAGSTGRPFLQDLGAIPHTNLLLALIGGIIFNIANLLLVAAIEIAGLAVAFPVGIGLALVRRRQQLYLVSERQPADALRRHCACGRSDHLRRLGLQAAGTRASRDEPARGHYQPGVCVSMGSFYPFVARSMSGRDAPGPYAVSFIFVVGVALCAIPFNYLLMRKPLDAQPSVSMEAIRCTSAMASVVRRGGAIWCTGGVFNFVASRAHIAGPAVLLYWPKGPP